jgi:transposase InsO family protein
MINLLKHRSTEGNRFWSAWVESISRDVECIFGILNRRWRFGFLERNNRHLLREFRMSIQHLSEWILPIWTKVCHFQHFYVSMGSSYKSTYDTTYGLIHNIPESYSEKYSKHRRHRLRNIDFVEQFGFEENAFYYLKQSADNV